jgi:hypothetical protein
MARSPTSNLYADLVCLAAFYPEGNDYADTANTQIADVLEVDAHPYVSDDSQAQTLIPAGWSWSTDQTGRICAVRNSDGATAFTGVADGDGNAVFVPLALMRCIAAVRAVLMEGNDPET